ncbi:hypothetical protein M8C21_015256 [Ambrosia artemisiifolia]|uniref:Protein kinase domain-containing protein n=1 Tax=Ambrosia artemisiifolia TaxID=4212 RepID=A0AAD5BME3_AMBAR|nr:hypothetical protein M8C21_015256 [Ambrosia artemisiifolia]
MNMKVRIEPLLVLPLIYAWLACGQNEDLVYLEALRDSWQNIPPNWVGSDPCRDKWDGISCNNSRVTSITLVNINLMGELSGDIGQLSELQVLDLSYNKGLKGSLTQEIGKLKKLLHLHLIGCSFNGPLPLTLGSLPQLTSLSLNCNGFTGPIPPSIGNLSKLFVLDLADNKLSGSIPVSPGLDLLFNTRHFHFGNNRLSGEIPSQLFNSKMTLIHVLFEDNQLTGTIPLTLGLVQKLEVLRLDSNLLSGMIPSSINNLKLLKQLYLSNNKFEGTLPNLTSMSFLNYLDMSNNSFEQSEIPPWISSLQSLTTLMMHDTRLQGKVPVDLFHIPQIENVILRNNQLDGTLDFGESYSESLRLIDVSYNSITAFTQRRYSADLILNNNPVCMGLKARPTYCDDPKESNSSYSTPPNNCIPAAICSVDQVSSPNCNCSYPYTATLTFKATYFSDLGNSTIYTSIQSSMMDSFISNQLPVDSVSLSNPTMNAGNLVINLEIFPSGDVRFNRSGICQIGFLFSNQTYRPPSNFGPYTFLGNSYNFFSAASNGKNKPVSIGVIIGGSVGVCVLVLLLFIVGLHAYRQKRKAKRSTKMNSPFASWDPEKDNGGYPQLKGTRSFTFEELNTFTNNFTATANIGSGGYGMVYRATLPNGQLVAIKRAQHRSTRGGTEFRTEIELLSRVHHKNLVSLVGFCFDEGEQMLVYEYIANGSLKDSLSGTFSSPTL